MKYTTKELSSCKTKVDVSVDAEEINAAITSAVALQQKGIQLKGFRKGHVPSAVIEQRFKGQLYHDAANSLVNVHIQQVMQELSTYPIGGMMFEKEVAIDRDTPLEYSFTFEHVPSIELPNYEGLSANQKVEEPSEEAVAALLQRLREDRASFVPVDGDGPANDGEYAQIDLDVIVDGKSAPDFPINDTKYLVGNSQSAFKELDELVKTLKVNTEGEKEVDFPQDFLNPHLQGKHATLKIKLHAITKRVLPEVDEAFCKQFKCENREQLNDYLKDMMGSNVKLGYRQEAQNALVQQILDQTPTFDLPESLVELQLRSAVNEASSRAEQVGKSLNKDQIADIRAKSLAGAEASVRRMLVLMAIALKEGLSVTDKEVEMNVFNYCQRTQQDFKSVFEYYRSSGLVYRLRDNLLAQKGSDAVYAKAKITMIPAQDPVSAQGAASAEAPAAEQAAPQEETKPNTEA